MNIKFESLKKSVIDAGYLWFSGGAYDLNLVGIRTKDSTSNAFNDFFCVAYNDGKADMLLVFPATTDPGLFWRLNPENVSGVAIVVPGQYRGMWKIGRHHGKFPALVQARPVEVYRDNNHDSILDTGADVKRETGMFGINCHHAKFEGKSVQVDKWSAGCTVIADYLDHQTLMEICEKAAEKWGNSFTYTLLTEDQVK